MQITEEQIEQCQSYMRTAQLCDSMKRKVPGHILGALAKAEAIWKEWPNIPQSVRDATRLYWDVRNRTKDAMPQPHSADPSSAPPPVGNPATPPSGR